jgi:NitT/TauT family transport system permease protein
MIKKVLKYTVIAAIWICLWQLLAMAVGQELLFPSPLSVIKRLALFLVSPNFYKTVGTSLLRVSVGMLAGVAMGILGGVLCACFRFARDFFAPMLAIIKSTPVASFIILLVLWLSRDVTPAVIAAIMVLPVVWANIETGIIETDRGLLEMAQVYSMSRTKRLTEIYIPSVYPYFLSSMRSSLGMAWKAGIAAEVLLLPLISIGKMIAESNTNLETVDLFAWTAIVVILSVIIEKLTVLALKLATKSNPLPQKGGVSIG